jgi:4-amino-4-deoxychorismate lyase
MSLLFETIKCQNRQLKHLFYHNNRVKSSRNELFGINEDLDFENSIKIPDWVGEGLYRCRINYGDNIEKIDFYSYDFKHPKLIQIVENTSIKYNFKFENRDRFHKLLADNSDVDDVIITQNNYLTDATYANLAFFDGSKWFTPYTYLLLGTKRMYLLDNQLLVEDEIKVKDLNKFKKIAFINAMRDLDLAYYFEILGNKILIKTN